MTRQVVKIRVCNSILLILSTVYTSSCRAICDILQLLERSMIVRHKTVMKTVLAKDKVNIDKGCKI